MHHIITNAISIDSSMQNVAINSTFVYRQYDFFLIELNNVIKPGKYKIWLEYEDRIRASIIPSGYFVYYKAGDTIRYPSLD